MFVFGLAWARPSLICMLTALTACAPEAPTLASVADWELIDTGVKQSFRGLSVVTTQVIWASGSAGTVLRTVDGGLTWISIVVPGAETLDLRDIEAFSADHAIVLSAGRPARIFVTADGGASWNMTHNDDREGIFYDAMAFWDPDHGIAFGDPIDGRFAIIVTADGGASWNEPAERPLAIEGEAGFAASGSCLTVGGEADVWFGSGGTVARVFHSQDRGESWSSSTTPMANGLGSTGIFSISFVDALHGVIGGGDYEQPEVASGNIALTDDGGRSWRPAASSPSGFRSAVRYLNAMSEALLTVGSRGSDVSFDGGRSWIAVDHGNFHALDLVSDADGVTAWAIGANGIAGVAHWARP